MSTYTVTTNFTSKDTLPIGDSAKLIKGSEFGTEFANISTAINDIQTNVVTAENDISLLQTSVDSKLPSSTNLVLTLDGDATGTATFTGMTDATLTVAVVDDSHSHDGRYYTESEVDTLLDDKANTTELFSGSYDDLTNKPTIPTIPTNVSAFTNDSGYLTSYSVTQGDVTAHQAALSITESQISDLGAYLTDYTVTVGDVTAHQASLSITESQISDLGAYITAVPASSVGVSEINATAGSAGDVLALASGGGLEFISVEAAADTNYYLNGATFTSSTGNLSLSVAGTTDVNVSLDGRYALAGDVFSGSYTDLTNKPTIPTVPTNVSDFTNDSGYITAVPAEYLTQTEGDARYVLTTKDIQLTLDGDATGSCTFSDLGDATLTVAVSNDSHTHDTRYYTKTQSDNAYAVSDHNHNGLYYTKTEGDVRYLQSVPSTYLTETQSDVKYLQSVPTEYLTETEGDARYLQDLSIGNWDIMLDGDDLVFNYNGTDVFKLTTTGEVIAKSSVTANGAP